MSLRSDSSIYVDLTVPGLPEDEARRLQQSPLAWDTDYDACQQGSRTQMPHGELPVIATDDKKLYRPLWGIRGPVFNVFSVFIKDIADITNATTGAAATRPPIFKFDVRFGNACIVDHWQIATVNASSFDQKGLVVAGVIPMCRAMEIYGAVVKDPGQPTPEVPVRVRIRVLVALQANDLGLATFETAPASTTNGLVVTLGP